MSMSNFEVQVMLGCLDCEFADKTKLEEMKKHHAVKDWVKCSRVSGSCTYPFERDMCEFEGRLWCNHSNIDHFASGQLEPEEAFTGLEICKDCGEPYKPETTMHECKCKRCGWPVSGCVCHLHE